MAVPDIGQTAARRLYAVATGQTGEHFELVDDVAENLAAACDQLVDDLQRARDTGHLVTGISGFPDLPTGRALTRGFADKGSQYLDIVIAFQETALLYKAAYLAAGNRLAAAEAANRAALTLVADHLDAT